MQGDLDQLWYTWSKNGLDSMAMGYRVRAASGELRNTQSMRYRILDRFLRYESPQGININEFDARIAPISYAFISNGPEHLLIRKVFKGRDLAGRNSVFFTHLIAGLPDEFTVRDAIRLWDCSDIWVDSEDLKAANDTLLEPLPYATLKRHADRSQQALSLPFVAIRARLEELLLAILCQNGLTQKVYLVGRSNLAAALLYGLTHCLPLSMLGGNFTFTTYESNPNEIEATFVTTVTGTELNDPTYLDVRAGDMPPASPADLQKYKSYVTVALHYLVSGNVETFLGFLKKMEIHHCQNADQLIEEFNLAFGQGPLTFKQVETIITHADEYADKLRDPLFQQQSAALLLEQREYWHKQGSKTFQQVVARLGSAGLNQTDPTRQALAAYFYGTATSLLASLQESLRQFKTLKAQGQDPWKIPQHCGYLLLTLLPPASNEQFWLGLLNDFAQPAFNALIKSDALWPFQSWLLEQAAMLPQPQHLLPQMQTWLDIPSWEKLEEVFALNLPAEWSYTAISGRIQDVPRGALPLIQKHERLFTAALQQHLQQGGQANINAASSFFQHLVEYGYPNRVPFLLALVNTYYEAGFVGTIFSLVGLAKPQRLQAHEISAVLIGCRPEVIATCTRAQPLADYLQEFILTLTPAKLTSGNIPHLLGQIGQLSSGPGFSPLLPVETANLAQHWLAISTFINSPTIDRYLLTKTEAAIKPILRSSGPAAVNNLVQTFANEFIPVLARQARTEFDLEIIQDILGTSMTSTRWDLLRWLALLAGQNHSHLYELIPYVICGIREAERSGQSVNDLDTYLHSIFLKQEKEMLKNVDTAMNCDIWPNSLRQRWDSWRGRNKKSFPIPSLRSSTGRLPVEQQQIRLPDPTGYAPAPGSTYEQPGYAPQRQKALDQLAYAPTTPAAPRQVSSPQPSGILAILPAPYRPVSYEEYMHVYPVMPFLLSYWLSHKLPAETSKEHSKLLNFEIQTLSQIKKSLEIPSEKPLRALVTYLAYDVLIAEAIKNRLESEKVLAQSLDPNQYLKQEFDDFRAFMAGKISDEIAYRNGLRLLIRRYLVIYQVDKQKNNLKDVFGKGGFLAFLEKEQEKFQFPIN